MVFAVHLRLPHANLITQQILVEALEMYRRISNEDLAAQLFSPFTLLPLVR